MHNDVLVIPFDPRDLDDFVPANKEQFDFVCKIPDFFFNLQNALSIWRGDVLLAVTYWVSESWNRSASMYFIPSIELKKKFNKNVLKSFRDIINFVKAKHVRIDADCEDNPVFKRFLEFLGFQKEGVLRCASYKNDDLILYSIINDNLRKTLKEEKHG